MASQKKVRQGRLRVNVTDETFEEEVLNSQAPVLVSFWASWCPACKMMQAVVERLHEQYKDKVKVLKHNIDLNPKYSEQYGVYNVPTWILFENGEVVNRRFGAMTRKQLIKLMGVDET